jgi:ankyrin repeat protein
MKNIVKHVVMGSCLLNSSHLWGTFHWWDIANKYNVNIADFEGKTYLHEAVSRVDLEAIRALKDRGANMDATDREGYTPLHWVARSEWLEGIEALLHGGAKINAVDREGKTPLHWAVKGGWLEGVEALLSGGANVYARDSYGETPLDLAETKKVRDLLVGAKGESWFGTKMRNTWEGMKSWGAWALGH